MRKMLAALRQTLSRPVDAPRHHPGRAPLGDDPTLIAMNGKRAPPQQGRTVTRPLRSRRREGALAQHRHRIDHVELSGVQHLVAQPALDELPARAARGEQVTHGAAQRAE